MTEYWKATNTDGRDFYTGSVDYAAALASGEPLPELPGDSEFPGRGWYHLATVPTACVGMSWPCRLFEAEPVGDVFMDNGHRRYKIGCTSVRVLREIEAHRVFGPQGEQVAALIERCRTLSAAELDRLYGAWDAARYTALDAARATALDAARATARATAWHAAWDAALDAVYGAWDATRYAARYAAWDPAWDAAWGAACGLLFRDLIGQYPGWDQDAYDLLTGPWRTAIGPIHPDDGDEGGLDDD